MRPFKGTHADGLPDSPHHRNCREQCPGCLFCTADYQDAAATVADAIATVEATWNTREEAAHGTAEPPAGMESMRAEQLASEDTPADETANVAATPDDTSGCDENVSAKRTMDSMYGGDGRGADATARTRRRFSRDTRAKRIDTKKPGHFLTSFQQVNDLLDQLFDIYGEDAEAMAQQMLQQFLGELNFSSANALDQFVNDKKIDAQTKADIYAALENTFGALVGDFKDRLQRRNEANSPGRAFRLRKVSFETAKMAFKGLAGKMVGRFKNRRSGIRQDVIIWDSSPLVDRDRLVNRLCGIAIATTPVIFQHACYFLEGLWLRVPWTNGLFKYIYDKVAPNVRKLCDGKQADILAEHEGPLDLGYDACFSGYRKAQTARGAMSIQNKGKHEGMILKSISSTVGESATREDLILRQMFEWSFKTEVDIASVCMDESSARSIVSQTVRRFMKDRSQKDQVYYVQVLVDMWHAKKNSKKGLAKHLESAPKTIIAAVRKLSTLAATQGKCLSVDMLYGEQGLITLVSENMMASFVEAHKVYEDAGEQASVDWELARAGADTMQELLTELCAKEAPIQMEATKVKEGADPASVLREVQTVRAQNNETKGLDRTSKSWRDPAITSLQFFNVNSNPKPLHGELVAIVKGMHADYSSQKMKDDPAWNKVAALAARVNECLPSAQRRAPSFTFAAALDAAWPTLIAAGPPFSYQAPLVGFLLFSVVSSRSGCAGGERRCDGGCDGQ
jgi:hypothetical protein